MSSLHYDSNGRDDGTFKRTDPMATEILYEQQILNGSTFYTLHQHTDPNECWKLVAKCFYHHYIIHDGLIRAITLNLSNPGLVLLFVYYDSGSRRDLFQIPFDALAIN